jgi:parallel beta-helix repeat protein
MQKYLLIILLLLSCAVEGRVFYVSPTGSNSNSGTTLSAPWKTIGKAVATMAAGDTVYIREGTYKEYLTMRTNGTSSHRIVFAAYPGEHPVIDGSNKASNPDNPWSGDDFLFRIYGSYVTIKGLELKNAASFGLYVGGGSDYVVIDSVYVHNCYLSGIYFYKCSYGSATNCVVHDVYDYGPGGTGGGGNADGMGSSAGNSPTTVYGYHIFRNNLVYNCSDDGIDTWTSQYNTIEGNIVHHTGYSNASNGGSNSIGQLVGDGNGYKVGPGGNNIVRKNVSHHNRRRGFDVNGGDSSQFINNTAYYAGKGFSLYTEGIIAKNNINYRGTINISASTEQSNNSWNLGITNPDFASVDPESPEFLHLSPTSPAIDAGVDVGLPFKGAAPDLGAYEYEYAASVATSSSPVKMTFSIHPNPFHGTTVFSTGQAPTGGLVKFSVYNLMGQEIDSGGRKSGGVFNQRQ